MRGILPIIAGVIIVLGGVFGLSQYFASKDGGEVEVSGSSGAPGEIEPDLGNEHQQTATRELRLSASPPTSGPHPVSNVTSEGAIDDRAVIHALEQGNVVLVYRGEEDDPPPELKALQDAVTGPFDPELAAAGQMVILISRPDAKGIQALAWRHRLRVESPADPALVQFAEAWVGTGAP